MPSFDVFWYSAGRIRVGWQQRRKGQLRVFIGLEVKALLVQATLICCQQDGLPKLENETLYLLHFLYTHISI